MSADAEIAVQAPATVRLADEFAESGVGPVLKQLDDELIGLQPVKQRIREIAALLLVERVQAQSSASPRRRRPCT